MVCLVGCQQISNRSIVETQNLASLPDLLCLTGEIEFSMIPDAYQKKVLKSKVGSKLIWGSAFSGKTITLCLRAKELIAKNITPLLLCFSTHHRTVIKKYLIDFGIHEKVRVFTFKEWMLFCLSQRSQNSISSYTRVINREETLLWLKKHQNEWSGNDDPDNDLEIIWTEKLYSPEGQPSDYVDLVNNYQAYLKHNHLVDEIDLCALFEKNVLTTFTKDQLYILMDEAQEVSPLELKIISKLLLLMNIEIYVDYNQGVMAWRTPLSPISIKEFKKSLKVKKYYYLKNNNFNTKTLINCGSKVLRKNKNRVSKRIKTISNKKGEIHFYLFENNDEEGSYLANRLQQWLADPLNPEDQIGILVRNHQQAQEISVYLEGILASPYFAHGFLRNPSAQKILALLRTLLSNASDMDYDVLMNAWHDEKIKQQYFELKKTLEIYGLYFSCLVKTDKLKLFLSSNQNNGILVQKIFSPTNKIDVYSIEKWENQKLQNSGIVTIEQLEDENIQLDFEQAGEALWAELKEGHTLGYYEGLYAPTSRFIPGLVYMKKSHLLNEKDVSDHDKWNERKAMHAALQGHSEFFIDWFKSFQDFQETWVSNTSQDLLGIKKFAKYFSGSDDMVDLPHLKEVFSKMYLRHLTATQNLERFTKLYRTASVSSAQSRGRITLCTIHEGRHLQFQKIWIPRMNQFEFPHALSCSGEKLEEERRLFYTAIMRAEETVILSSVKQNHHISSFIRDAGLI